MISVTCVSFLKTIYTLYRVRVAKIVVFVFPCLHLYLLYIFMSEW